jgi:hypothetical protein
VQNACRDLRKRGLVKSRRLGRELTMYRLAND